jgi:hypothetical protein
MTHDLKSWPANFIELLRGRRFEIRLNDRNFALGDWVHVSEYLPAREMLTGRTLDFRIDDLAPFALPGASLVGVRYLILHYTLIVQAEAVVITPPVVPREELPTLELWAVVKQSNRVMQMVEDERGETHQLFGTGMDLDAPPGTAGKFRLYASGVKRFSRVQCAHLFGAGPTCTECGMPISMAGR